MPLFAQDIIHKLELGRGYRVLKFGVGIVAVVALAAFYNMAAFQNFSTAEAMDAAQVARNVSEGKGFTTDLVRPLSLYLLGTTSVAANRSGTEVGRDVAIAPQASSVAATNLATDGAATGVVANGMGATASRPADLAKVIERCPDLANGPGYPLLLAGVLKAMPFAYPEMNPAMPFRTYSPEVWIAGFNQFLLLGCAWVIFLIGRRLFDEPVAWVSAAVFVGAELFWRLGVLGVPT